VPGGTRYLGTFDRGEAVVREELEYFASGHPLVEGLLAELEDGSRGRTALVELTGAGGSGLAFLLLVVSPGSVRAEVCDHEGRPRPDWMPLLLARRRDLRGLSRHEGERRLPPGLDWRASLEKAAGRLGEGLRAAAAVYLVP
jgi:ATP-dependent helicase HepA